MKRTGYYQCHLCACGALPDGRHWVESKIDKLCINGMKRGIWRFLEQYLRETRAKGQNLQNTQALPEAYLRLTTGEPAWATQALKDTGQLAHRHPYCTAAEGPRPTGGTHGCEVNQLLSGVYSETQKGAHGKSMTGADILTQGGGPSTDCEGSLSLDKGDVPGPESILRWLSQGGEIVSLSQHT